MEENGDHPKMIVELDIKPNKARGDAYNHPTSQHAKFTTNKNIHLFVATIELTLKFASIPSRTSQKAFVATSRPSLSERYINSNFIAHLTSSIEHL